MINDPVPANALVIYKGKPALVKDCADGKITISLQNSGHIKVREKDIELIHVGPVKDFNQIECHISEAAVREVWELLSDDCARGSPDLSLKELAALIFSEFTPAAAYSVYLILRDGLYFTGSIAEILPRPVNEVEAEETKRNEKMRETGERAQFLEQIKACLKKPNNISSLFTDPVYARFMQDVEALAYGKSAKSRTMKELGLGETPEEAHSLLLKTGFWAETVNPHPSRFGLSPVSAHICPDAPEQEERRDLCYLAAFAIDNAWSNDPDDAVSLENTICEKSGKTLYNLYVHVADPASSITFDSPAEKEARDRGATLYLPEGAVRMLAEDSLPMFALGLSEKSLALTFKMTIDESASVIDTEIFPSVVKVQRITYEDADAEIGSNNSLRALYELSQKIYRRRINQGAVNIELPDVHIKVSDGNVEIEPIVNYRSVSLVRECMLIAGEGAGIWAASKNIAFPYISQEVEMPETNKQNFEGLAGSWQLRRCMRPRILSAKPGFHQGLGLDVYSQVTSPLRRYTDLLAHLQIRAFLRTGRSLGGTPQAPLSIDEVSARLGFCEAAAAAAVQAERASENHWLMVYLANKKDSVWDAVALENKGNRMQVIIPALALETQVALQKNVIPNENVKLQLKSVNIPRGEAIFMQKTEK
ncbi:MAG: ribonuclease catalytic domain-containing protein [Treponema sp.]|nr:ribonuclease catalytic domain-containing protein [Treponema sp.]